MLALNRAHRGLWRPKLFLLAATVLSLSLLAAGRTPLLDPHNVDVGARESTLGVENSWIRVQNIGEEPAAVQVEYYSERGRRLGRDVCPVQDVCPALAPGDGWTFFQHGNPSLPGGFRGSAVVSTDQPIVALLAKDVVEDDGAFRIGGDTVGATSGSHTLYLPLMANQDGPDQGWNGRFAVQNLSSTVTTCVTVTYLSNYTDSEIHWDPYDPDDDEAKPKRSCPRGGMPLRPNGTIFRDPETMGVPPQYTGSVRIDTHENDDGVPPDEQFLSATADAWNSRLNHLASYRGLDESELGRTVILPLIDRQVGPHNQWSTNFQIVTKNSRRPARVTIRFEGWNLGVDPPRFVVKQNTLTVRAARLCLQMTDDFSNCLAPGDKLPLRFVGTARLRSTRPIGVIVSRSSHLIDVYTSYRGFRPEDGAKRLLFPVLNKNYGSVGDRHGWNSWFRVMVADGGPATVTIRYFGLNLPDGEVSYTKEVFREFTVFQWREGMLPDGFAGTAVIESDRPIVGLANLTTDVFFGDPDLIYNGIALE